MALEIPESTPSDVLLNPSQEVVENGPGAPWANSIRFPYQILRRHEWKMVLELTLPIPSCSDQIIFRNSWNMVLELSGPIPCGGFIKILLGMDGNCSWKSLGHFHQISAFNLH